MLNLVKYISFIGLSVLLMGYTIAFPLTQQEDIDSNKTDEAGLKQGYWVVKSEATILEEGEYFNNRKSGIWKSYHGNQNLKSEIRYTNGEAKGKAKFYYKNGKLRESGNWQVDHWEGDYKYYFESGKLSYDWFYNADGKRQGEQRYFYDNGSKMYEGYWENGKTEGILKVYNDSGVLIQEKVFNNGKFTEAKNTSPTEKNVNPSKFQGTGFHTIMNLMGKIDEKGFFVKGQLFNGEKHNYDKDGNLITITMYENGRISGTQRVK